MELRLSGRTITPGLEALAGATINATARTIIVDIVSLSGSTSAADGVPLDAAGGTVALRSAAGCRSSLGRLPAWKNAAACGGNAISCDPPPQAISAGVARASSLLDSSVLSSKLDKMEKVDLLRVAADWSHWGAPPPRSVVRKVAVPRELRPDIALVIQGVRRCGKSTLLEQLIDRYELDRSKCLFINFEDPRLAQSLDHATLQDLVDAFEADRGPGCTYLFDEVQWVDGWQRWLRAQLDRPKQRRFVVTGSNAHLLSGELGSSLTGRHHAIELFPFDLGEFRVLRPKATLEDYLDAGGFPATIGASDHDRLLRGYFQDIVERDMRERVGARSSTPLRQLVQMLFESAGSETSIRRLAAALGISVDTTSLYIDAAESAYLAIGCPFFSWSERQRIVRNRKYYPIDTGLRRGAVTTTGHDRGKQLECAVFLLLRQRFRQVHYWRGTGEIDFVVDHRGKPTPVQVSWDATKERARRAVDEFHAAHPTAAEAVFVTAESFEAGVPELAPADDDGA